MLTWLRSRSRLGKTASALYGSIVTQARIPEFYTRAGVPDTMEGRFSVISVHMFLALERIRSEGANGDELARALLETFVTDIDDNMREIGIGDMGVPRRVKKAAAALHEQMEVYRAAITESSDTQLNAATTRYIVGQDGINQSSVVASYIRRASNHLAQQSWGEIEAGRITFPPF